MASLKLQITTSMAMLPVSIAIAVVLWLWQAPYTLYSMAGLLCLLVLTLALRWLSNTLQLIRVRSWAVSSIFLVTVVVCAPLHGWSVEVMGVTALYLVHAGALMFSTYVPRPQLPVFISTVALACLTMVLPQTVWLLPLCVVAMMIPLRIWSARTLAALFLGFLLPYELWAAWHIVQGTLAEAATALVSGIIPSFSCLLPPYSPLLTPSSILLSPYFFLLTPIVLFTIFSLVHFSKSSLDDKISTRMRYIALLLQWPVLLLLVVLQAAESSAALVPAWLLCSAPFLARYYVFSRGWRAGLAFWLFVLALLAMIFYPCFS